MNKLAVPVASITASGFVIDVVVPIADIAPSNAGGVPALTVHVRGALSEAGSEYVFRGRIAGTFEHVCDRCLEPTSLPFDAEVAWVFKHGLPLVSDEEDLEEDDEDEAEESAETALGFEGSEIDLAPGVWEEVVLAMPLKFVCRANCAGLCEHCGANLNRGPCTCREEGSDKISNKGLAGLAELFPDLQPKRSED